MADKTASLSTTALTEQLEFAFKNKRRSESIAFLKQKIQEATEQFIQKKDISDLLEILHFIKHHSKLHLSEITTPNPIVIPDTHNTAYLRIRFFSAEVEHIELRLIICYSCPSQTFYLNSQTRRSSLGKAEREYADLLKKIETEY